MKRAAGVIIGLVVAVGLLAASPFVVHGAQTPSDSGLKIQGALAEYKVTPGQVIVHPVVVSLGAQAKPLDMLVDARGLGQGPDGAVIPLEPAQDTSPVSARTFIQKIDKTSFHLDPGGTQTLNVTIVVPQNIGANTRYADIYVHSLPSGASRIGFVLASNIPVILQGPDVTTVVTGKITGIKVADVVSGQPIEVTTSLQNTGTLHYKAQDQVTLLDSTGRQIETQAVPISENSIVPGYSRDFTASFNFLDKLSGLPAGTYTATSKVMYADGKILGTTQTTFELTAPYQPFPGVDPASLVVTTYKNEIPHAIDARRQADVVLSFIDTGVVSGTVVIGKFKGEPAGTPKFGASVADHGMGSPGTKFVGVGVKGFSTGTAQLKVFYTDQELNGANPNGLYIAYRTRGQWVKLDNITVFTGGQNVQGELPVAVLNSNPVFGVGIDGSVGTPTVAPVPTAVAGESLVATPPSADFPLLPVAGVAAGVVGVGLVAAIRSTGSPARPRRRPGPRIYPPDGQ